MFWAGGAANAGEVRVTGAGAVTDTENAWMSPPDAEALTAVPGSNKGEALEDEA